MIVEYSSQYLLKKYRESLKTLRDSLLISQKTKEEIDIYFETENSDNFVGFNELVASNKELRKYYFGF